MIAIRRRNAPRITALLLLGDFSPTAQQSFPDWMPPVLLVGGVPVRAPAATYRLPRWVWTMCRAGRTPPWWCPLSV